MIEIQGLTKSYGATKAIDNLNFSIKKGEVVGFLGPNGAGKSTTMKIITGYMAPSDGAVTVGGYDVYENPIEVKKRIGYLPEIPPVYLDMYVADYLKYVASIKHVPKTELSKKVDRALEKTNLGDVRNRLIGNLSKGYRQRVGIAEAIVSEPEILILDEPTVGLDPKQVAEIRSLIQTLAGEHTVILSTHILPEVQATCKRIIIINRGKIVAEDTLEQLNRHVSGSSRILIRTRKGESQAISDIKNIAGVLGYEFVSPHSYYVDVTNLDLTDQIAEYVVSKGLGLLELIPQTNNLEEIFIRLTSEK